MFFCRMGVSDGRSDDQPSVRVDPQVTKVKQRYKKRSLGRLTRKSSNDQIVAA
jgi:hypothetical protein